MDERSPGIEAMRRRTEAKIQMLAGGASTVIVWTAEGQATVLGRDGKPYLEVESTEHRGQWGIRVRRVGESRDVRTRRARDPRTPLDQSVDSGRSLNGVSPE